MANQIKVAISCGDLNGIGVETLLDTFSDERMYEYFFPILYANEEVITSNLSAMQGVTVDYKVIRSVEEAQPNVLNVLHIEDLPKPIELGTPDPELSPFTVRSLELATQDVIHDKADALVTLPINKEIMNKANFNYPGHTEYLKDVAKVDETLMFLVSQTLRVGLVTNHFPIKDVAKHVTKANIIKKVKLMEKSLVEDFGIDEPKIAILGLNPHAGDNGLIGTEELKIIIPAIDELKSNQIIAVGPYSADGFFGKAMYGKFDGVIAMYHDQGLLPFKMISFDEGVNYTAGLPFVRTSPDHGTAYNIAGKNKANPGSLRNALFMAKQIINHRENAKEYSETNS